MSGSDPSQPGHQAAHAALLQPPLPHHLVMRLHAAAGLGGPGPGISLRVLGTEVSHRGAPGTAAEVLAPCRGGLPSSPGSRRRSLDRRRVGNAHAHRYLPTAARDSFTQSGYTTVRTSVPCPSAHSLSPWQPGGAADCSSRGTGYGGFHGSVHRGWLRGNGHVIPIFGSPAGRARDRGWRVGLPAYPFRRRPAPDAGCRRSLQHPTPKGVGVAQGRRQRSVGPRRRRARRLRHSRFSCGGRTYRADGEPLRRTD